VALPDAPSYIQALLGLAFIVPMGLIAA